MKSLINYFFTKDQQLIHYCAKGNLAEAQRLLEEEGADPNTCLASSAPVLSVACSRGHVEIVELLLSKGSRIELGDKFGCTALILTCERGHTAVVDTLLRHGASPNNASRHGSTPLMYAAKYGHVDIVKLLLKYGADVYAKPFRSDETALALAKRALLNPNKENYREIVRLLNDSMREKPV